MMKSSYHQIVINTVLSIFILSAFSSLAFGDETMTNDYSTAAEMGLMKGFPPPTEKQVDRSALLKPPYNRWAYQNMRMLYPSANVPHANTVEPLKKSIDGAIERLKIQKPESGLADVETWLTETYTDAVVVVHRDRIVLLTPRIIDPEYPALV